MSSLAVRVSQIAGNRSQHVTANRQVPAKLRSSCQFFETTTTAFVEQESRRRG